MRASPRSGGPSDGPVRAWPGPCPLWARPRGFLGMDRSSWGTSSPHRDRAALCGRPPGDSRVSKQSSRLMAAGRSWGESCKSAVSPPTGVGLWVAPACPLPSPLPITSVAGESPRGVCVLRQLQRRLGAGLGSPVEHGGLHVLSDPLSCRRCIHGLQRRRRVDDRRLRLLPVEVRRRMPVTFGGVFSGGGCSEGLPLVRGVPLQGEELHAREGRAR